MTQPKTKAEWTARRDELQEVVAAKKDALQTAESKAAQHRLLTGQPDPALDAAADNLKAQLQRDEIAVQLAGEQIAECERATEKARRDAIAASSVDKAAYWVEKAAAVQAAVIDLARAVHTEREAARSLSLTVLEARRCLTHEEVNATSAERMGVIEPLTSRREASKLVRAALATILGHAPMDWDLDFMPVVSQDRLHRSPADEMLVIHAESIASRAVELVGNYTEMRG